MSKNPKIGQNGHFLTFSALLLAPWWPKPEKNLLGTGVYAQSAFRSSFVPELKQIRSVFRRNVEKREQNPQIFHLTG